MPDERVLPILHNPKLNTGRLADWNHIYHPARTVKASGFGGDAVREARKQFVLRREQHDAYHAHYDGPPLPASTVERFRAVTLCCAGYIPLRAIHFSGLGAHEVQLSPAQRERLRTSGEVRVGSLSLAQRFLTQFVLMQPADHIRPAVIDRFLSLRPDNPTEAREQCYLANLLLSLVIDRVEPALERPYTFGRSYELLQPGLPKRPGDFVRKQIVRSGKNMQSLVAELTKKLSLQRNGTAVQLGGAVLAQAA